MSAKAKRLARSKRFHIRLTKGELSMLKQVANICGLSSADVIRLAIRSEFSSRKPWGLK